MSSKSQARQTSFLDELSDLDVDAVGSSTADGKSRSRDSSELDSEEQQNCGSGGASLSPQPLSVSENSDPSDEGFLNQTVPSDDLVESSDTGADDTPVDRLVPTVVRASAGTGKTYQLTARLFKIFLQGAEPDTVLATTFTRKAAGEILDRLLLTLAKAADPEDAKALDDLRQQVEIPSLQRKTCLQLLQRLLREVHRLRICTLDSLFSQLARSLPYELSLPPNWRLTDEIEEVWLRERAVAEVIRGLQAAELTTLLAMLGKGDVRRSVTRELIGVVDAAYAQQRQCDADVWKRVRVPRLPDRTRLTWAAAELRAAKLPQKTLRSKADEYADCLELQNLSPLVEQTLTRNIANAKRSMAEVKFGRSKFPETLNEAFEVVYEAAKSEALQTLSGQNNATGALLSHYDQQITRLKQSLRTLAFDDVAVRLADYFQSFDAASLTEVTEGAIDHLLLDEFQDTSPVQWQVLRPIAMRAASVEYDERQTHRSFFCVGDTKQAIYGWRGGVAEIFEAVSDELDVDQCRQDESFRSSAIVIDAVNRVFRNLARHPMASVDSHAANEKAIREAEAIQQFSSSFPEHKAHHKNLPGRVTLETSPLVDGDSATKKSRVLNHAAAKVEALNLAAPGCTVGVLTRTNSCVGELIHLLDSRGVNVSQEGGNPLTDSAAVEAVLSAFMLAEHPADRRWSFHLSPTPLAEMLSGPTQNLLDRPSGAAAAVRQLVEDRGLVEAVEVLAGRLASVCDRRDTVRLRQLVQLAIEYEPNATGRLRDFVRLVREKRVERPQPAPVRVMTVHQAKGLEFDIVVLAELDQPLTGNPPRCVADVRQIGEPPHGMSRYLNHDLWHFLPKPWQRAFGAHAASAVTESICLLYVAMTRARHALHMIMLPASNKKCASRTASSLIYHGSLSEEDPTLGNAVLFESGDPEWYQELPAAAKAKANQECEANSAIDHAQTESRKLAFRPAKRARGGRRKEAT